MTKTDSVNIAILPKQRQGCWDMESWETLVKTIYTKGK